MTDKKTHVCRVCGAPTTHFTIATLEVRDDVGELRNVETDEAGRHYYCEKHLPHLRGESLEDILG